MTLFHYSPLAHLPPIMAEGLWRGDVAVPWANVNHVAVSLTTQTDPDRAAFWIDPIPYKVGVRYVCNIPGTDPKLEPTKETGKRLKVPKRWVAAFDPRGQAKWWYFYHGTVPPEWFAVEMRSRSGYVCLGAEELARVRELVGAEREKFVRKTDPARPWYSELSPKEEGYVSRLFVEEHYPADFLGIAPQVCTA